MTRFSVDTLRDLVRASEVQVRTIESLLVNANYHEDMTPEQFIQYWLVFVRAVREEYRQQLNDALADPRQTASPQSLGESSR